MTLVTTILFGLIYPLAVTGLAQVLFRDKANGSLLTDARSGAIKGSRLIGQPFASAGYFHARPSAAGAGGYDASVSGGSNLAPTSEKLIARIKADAEKLQAENPSAPVPVDLLTTSASGLDPHVSPASVEFQVARVARERGVSERDVRALVAAQTEGRQFGFLGEPRVNVLLLNLALDEHKPMR